MGQSSAEEKRKLIFKQGRLRGLALPSARPLLTIHLIVNPPSPPPPPPPTPVHLAHTELHEPQFGDPTLHHQESHRAIRKGIGCGCGGCSLVAAAVIGLFVLIFAGIMWGIGRSDAAALILQTAQQSPELQAELGTPITAGWSVTGNYRDVNGVGSADISLPLTGPRGEAQLKAKASRPAGGQWQVDEAEAKVQATGRVIRIVSPPAPALPRA